VNKNNPQRLVALEKANRTRLAIAGLKRDLREGSVTLADAFEHWSAQKMLVFDLLRAQRRWGDHRSRHALHHAAVLLSGNRFSPPISETKQVGLLTDRQKRALLQACGCDNERSAA
jgi:hypothetical protein